MDHEFVELSDGRLVCHNHGLVVCGKCCVDYSFAGPDASESDDIDDDDDDIVELPDGRLVCRDHGLVICFKCGYDFSFADNGASENEDEAEWQKMTQKLPKSLEERITVVDSNIQPRELDDWEHEKIKPGTGRVFPIKFIPPSPTSTPASLFIGTPTYAHWTRFVHRQDKKKMLIFTDGACLNNGQSNPRAGWAFVHGPPMALGLPDKRVRVESGRLENTGPYGDEGGQTSNRAELRAVIAALNFRHWPGEWAIRPGEYFKTLVIATDSEYVVDGATTWARRWVVNNWKTSAGSPVKNKDLWQCLLGQFERLHDQGGMKIEFWRIPRKENNIADAAAKLAAEFEERKQFIQLMGI